MQKEDTFPIIKAMTFIENTGAVYRLRIEGYSLNLSTCMWIAVPSCKNHTLCDDDSVACRFSNAFAITPEDIDYPLFKIADIILKIANCNVSFSPDVLISILNETFEKDFCLELVNVDNSMCVLSRDLLNRYSISFKDRAAVGVLSCSKEN